MAVVTVGIPPNAAATVQGAPASDSIVTPVTARVEPPRVAPARRPLCDPRKGECSSVLPCLGVDICDDDDVVDVVRVALTTNAPGVLIRLNETVFPGSHPGKK